MITALVVTGHRTNPFDLEGSFTVQFNADDFSAEIIPDPVISRDFTLEVTLQASPVPSLDVRMVRETDGLRFEQRFECARKTRNFATLNTNFVALTKPELRGRINGSLFWDGFQGLLLARLTVPRARPLVHQDLQTELSGAERSM